MDGLREELERRARAAPARGPSPQAVWASGTRRHRVRRARSAALAAVVLLVVAVAGAKLARDYGPAVEPAGQGDAELGLPTRLNAPSPWSDAQGPHGPIAALGLANRTRAEGLTGKSTRLELFGVSAVDGVSRWITLPHVEPATNLGAFAVSPDGRWIGWLRYREPRADGSPDPLGWAVMDTESRKVRELGDESLGEPSDLGFEPAFSGDSRYFVVSYEATSAPRDRAHQLVAFDLGDGSASVLETPGSSYYPELGSAASGVVWSRGHKVFRVDPATSRRTEYPLANSIVEASWAPSDTSFAYLAFGERTRDRWRLFAGPTPATVREVPLDIDPDQILGWTDPQHVVLGHFRTTVWIVDITTGEVVLRDLAGSGRTVNAPAVASGMWQLDLRDPPDPEVATDPRRPLWAALGLTAAGAVVLGAMLVRRRVRRRD